MDLNILWFILVAVLYIGFFVLEGFAPFPHLYSMLYGSLCFL